MSVGIYCIENSLNGKKYVGQAVNVEQRMKENHDGCIALINAFEHYGEDNFIRYPICYCSIEELNDLEIYYIKALRSHFSEWGYNLSWGGTGVMRGRKHSQEAKDKIGNANRGRQFTKDQRDNVSKAHKGVFAGEKHPMFGKKGSSCPIFGIKRSDETKEKCRVGNTGRTMSPASRLKMSESRRGELNSRFGKKLGGTTSDYFGVTKKINKGHTYWVARIYDNQNRIYLGQYKLELEAAHAFDKYVIEHKLPNPLNFPK